MSIYNDYSIALNEILDTCMERIKEADGNNALVLAAMNSAVDAADRERNKANDRILASGSNLLLQRKNYEELVEQRKAEEAEELVPGTGSEDSPDIPENCTVGRHPEYAGQQGLRLTDKRGVWLTDWNERGYCERSKPYQFPDQI